MRSFKKMSAAVAVVSALAMTAACGSDDETATETDSPSASASPSESAAPEESEAPEAGDDVTANLVGPGCADYAEAVPDGEGSVQGMAALPVANAAGANPLLTTLTAAVSGELNPDVNLVDTLNGDEFTVFAPVNDAFAAIPKKTLNGVVADADTLSSVLTYHVIPGQIQPADLVKTTQTTVNGADVKVKGSVDSGKIKVNGANVICGGVQTDNAVVYLIDSVLLPPA